MSSFTSPFLRCQARHCQYAKDIALFVSQNQDRYLSHNKLYKILSIYEKWWISVGRYRSEPFERYVLHYIAERAFWSDLRDGKFIAKLLVFLFETESHFGFFLCPDKDCLPSRSFGSDYDRLSQFFLDHAYRQELIICGKRIVDLKVFFRSLWLHPCEVAVIIESPTLLHLLLQYGALITDGAVSIRKLRSNPSSGDILVITLCIIKTIVESFQRVLRNNGSEGAHAILNSMITCGQLIIRASPQMEKCVMRQMGFEFPGFNSPEDALGWVAEQALTELRNRLYFPVPLKHACRLEIRKMLHCNWQLPFGIDKLPIPNVLKGYLNLYFD